MMNQPLMTPPPPPSSPPKPGGAGAGNGAHGNGAHGNNNGAGAGRAVPAAAQVDPRARAGTRSSVYHGVSLAPKPGGGGLVWQAELGTLSPAGQGSQRWLGYFDSEIDAAWAYDAAVLRAGLAPPLQARKNNTPRAQYSSSVFLRLPPSFVRSLTF